MTHKPITTTQVINALKQGDFESIFTKLEKLGITKDNFFSGISQPNSVYKHIEPALIVMRKGRYDVLWAFIDKHNIDLTKTLITDNTDIKKSILSCAAKYNHIELIKEWHRRGLPLVIKERSSPLLNAIQAQQMKSIELLDSLGADWAEEKELESLVFMTSKDNYGSLINILPFKTSPIALGLSSPNHKIVHLTITKNKLTPNVWDTFIPNPDSRIDTNDNPFIRLESLVPHLLKKSGTVYYGNTTLYNEAWWKEWRSSGILDAFKKTPTGISTNIDAIIREDNTEISFKVLKALISDSDKKVNAESLKYCIKLLSNPRASEEAKKISLTSKRLKELWRPDGILGNIPVETIVRITNSPDENTPTSHLFSAMVLSSLDNPAMWKSGVKYKVFCDQFWNGLEYYNSLILQTIEQSRLPPEFKNKYSRFLPSAIPQNFYSIPENSNDQLFKILDLLSSNATVDLVKSTLHSLATTPNFVSNLRGKNSKHTIRLDVTKYLSIGQILEWGILKKYLDPSIVLSSIQKINDCPETKLTNQNSTLSNLNHFKMKIERHVLIANSQVDKALNKNHVL